MIMRDLLPSQIVVGLNHNFQTKKSCGKTTEYGSDKISFDYFSTRSDIDFNDTIIAKIVRINKTRLLTNDSDIRKMGGE